MALCLCAFVGNHETSPFEKALIPGTELNYSDRKETQLTDAHDLRKARS